MLALFFDLIAPEGEEPPPPPPPRGVAAATSLVWRGERCHGRLLTSRAAAAIMLPPEGRLVARGPVPLRPLPEVLAWEQRLMKQLPWRLRLGRLLFRGSWRERIMGWLEAAQPRATGNQSPVVDGFLLEVWNHQFRPVALDLVITPLWGGQGPVDETASFVPCSHALSLPVGRSRHVVVARLFQEQMAQGRPFQVALVSLEQGSIRLVIDTAQFVAFQPGLADGERGPIKCLVWDLDHTLWEGILLEQPPWRVRPEALALIQLLDQRGILHSIASRNDHAHALEHLQKLGVAEWFLAPAIHWGRKSDSLRHIASRLNLGLEALALVDDNPFERAEVSAALPMVDCFTPEEIPDLPHHPRLQGSTSREARHRRQYYREEMTREAVRSGFGADYPGFLSSCQIRLTVAPYQPAHRQRVAELMERTHQLNFSGSHEGPSRLPSLVDNPLLEKYVLLCRDRFGDYGLIGFGVVARQGGVVRVEEFMLSCRVQGKFLEQGFFHHIAAGAREIRVNYHPTERNRPARHLLEALGFCPEADGWRLDLTRHPLTCDFLTVETATRLEDYSSRSTALNTRPRP